ncbi:sugar phosphate isomerase/epimerase [Pontibacter ummariensis]|uniref:Sugar phosphate isomerase/epimerase n=1 Tax=Pontibacter ummariensis TaxID=1610492 RepID=A0A239C2L0_9BACT|nr:sugar phosphate isomerase/epimerase [Pontibacter ummariensis]PRY15506.1 sugar phosphate isomerase/epimerase [Pontibacter ummariensis]SNS13871.1 Sugar phosphate isomerase/epimerase [Pontibacter ummariensis]
MNKRRSFLQAAGFLLAGVFLAPSLTSCSSNTEAVQEDAAVETVTAVNDAEEELGIQLYTLREQIGQEGIESVIAKVADAGYKKVETYGYSKENGFWGLSPQQFSELLKKHNLTSPSGHYGFDQIIAGGNDEILTSYIDAAKAIGQTYITVPYLGDNLRQSPEDYRKVAQAINQAAKRVNEEGLKLAYHNHDFEFQNYDSTTGYQILLEETDPELVKMELDLYWAYRAGKDPVVLMQENPGRFVMWHVKDMDKNDPKLNTEIGSGSIDYKSLFEKAAADVEHIYVEQENFAPNMDPYQSIRQSQNYVTETLLQ